MIRVGFVTIQRKEEMGKKKASPGKNTRAVRSRTMAAGKRKSNQVQQSNYSSPRNKAKKSKTTGKKTQETKDPENDTSRVDESSPEQEEEILKNSSDGGGEGEKTGADEEEKSGDEDVGGGKQSDDSDANKGDDGNESSGDSSAKNKKGTDDEDNDNEGSAGDDDDAGVDQTYKPPTESEHDDDDDDDEYEKFNQEMEERQEKLRKHRSSSDKMDLNETEKNELGTSFCENVFHQWKYVTNDMLMDEESEDSIMKVAFKRLKLDTAEAKKKKKNAVKTYIKFQTGRFREYFISCVKRAVVEKLRKYREMGDDCIC